MQAGLGEVGCSPKLGFHLYLIEFIAAIKDYRRRSEEDGAGVIGGDLRIPHGMLVRCIKETDPNFLTAYGLRNRCFKGYVLKFAIGGRIHIGTRPCHINPVIRCVCAGSQGNEELLYAGVTRFACDLVDPRYARRRAGIAGGGTKHGSPVLDKPKDDTVKHQRVYQKKQDDRKKRVVLTAVVCRFHRILDECTKSMGRGQMMYNTE